MDSGGNVYVSSYWDSVGALKEFDADGNYLATIPRDGAGGNVEAAWIPGCLATDSADDVYALDTYGDGADAVVRKFDSAGNLLATIDTGTNESAGLAVDADGNVYVGDARNNVIRVFAPSAERTPPRPRARSPSTARQETTAGTPPPVMPWSAPPTTRAAAAWPASTAPWTASSSPPSTSCRPSTDRSSAGFNISTEGKHTVTYWAVDAAGNESEHQSADVWIDTIAPAGTFAIDGGATTTHSTSVTADSAVTDANGVEMNFSVDGESWTGWLPYAASEPLTLPAGDGTKTVEAEYRDPAGNELDLSDTIVLNTTMPTDVTPPTVTVDSPLAGAVYPSYPAAQSLTLDFSVDDEAGGSGTDFSLWHASVTWPDGHTTTVPLTLSPTASDAAVGLLPTSAQGDYTVTVTASDAAGNRPPPPSPTASRVDGQACWVCRRTRTVTATPTSTPTPRRTPLTLKFRLVSGRGGGLTKAQRCLQGKKIKNAKPRLYVWDVATHTLRFRAHKLFHRVRGNWYVYRWDTRKVNWDASWPRGQYRRMMLVIKLYDANGGRAGTVRLVMPRDVRNSTRARAKKATDTATLVSFRKMMTRDL